VEHIEIETKSTKWVPGYPVGQLKVNQS